MIFIKLVECIYLWFEGLMLTWECLIVPAVSQRCSPCTCSPAAVSCGCYQYPEKNIFYSQNCSFPIQQTLMKTVWWFEGVARNRVLKYGLQEERTSLWAWKLSSAVLRVTSVKTLSDQSWWKRVRTVLLWSDHLRTYSSLSTSWADKLKQKSECYSHVNAELQ